ncbi:MAG: hypothetical protein EBE86_026800 [Hormoscilla sp. GUM202]|nr:hypothetical protein [Hormoscilla sp. GUM202]
MNSDRPGDRASQETRPDDYWSWYDRGRDLDADANYSEALAHYDKVTL